MIMLAFPINKRIKSVFVTYAISRQKSILLQILHWSFADLSGIPWKYTEICKRVLQLDHPAPPLYYHSGVWSCLCHRFLCDRPNPFCTDPRGAGECIVRLQCIRKLPRAQRSWKNCMIAVFKVFELAAEEIKSCLIDEMSILFFSSSGRSRIMKYWVGTKEVQVMRYFFHGFERSPGSNELLL